MGYREGLVLKKGVLADSESKIVSSISQRKKSLGSRCSIYSWSEKVSGVSGLQGFE